MEQYKKDFIDFMVESRVLQFGEFTLKSGRKSPFYMNAGLYQSGDQLIKLGEFYARAIHAEYGTDFDVLFGPAYKGIPLSVGSKLHDGDRIVIIEDVTTSGASMAETVPILRAQADVDILGLMVSLNREEVGLGGEVSALDEIRNKYGFSTHAIVTMSEVVEHLSHAEGSAKPLIDSKMKKSLEAYYKEYGVKH